MLTTIPSIDALCLEIRPRGDWRLVGNFLIVILWATFFGISVAGYRDSVAAHRVTARSVGALAVMLAIFLYMTYILLKAMFYREVVSVTPERLSIHGELFSISISDRTYENSSISNLRYEEWSGGRSGKQTGIRFECDGRKVTFARQAGSDESCDLIDRVCKVYPFPTPGPPTPPGVVKW